MYNVIFHILLQIQFKPVETGLSKNTNHVTQCFLFIKSTKEVKYKRSFNRKVIENCA